MRNSPLTYNKVELDISFVNSCQKFNVFQKSLCFPLFNVSKFNGYAIKIRLLRTTINKRSKEKRKPAYCIEKIEKKIKRFLSSIESLSSTKRYATTLIVKVHKIGKTHHKELKALTRNCVLSFDSKYTFTYISSHNLTEADNEALQFGL